MHERRLPPATPRRQTWWPGFSSGPVRSSALPSGPPGGDGSTVGRRAAGRIGQTLRSAAQRPYLCAPAGHTGGVSRRISSPELIGRAAEVAALGAALADARRGRGRLVLVEGDAGIGKTRLVEDFTAQADGVRVLAGGGIPLASDTPYAPVLGILQALARLHPAAAGGLLPQDAPGRADPFGPTRLLAAAADAVRAVAAETPLVLVVEDLHWADASTRGLVSFLARVIRADPVLLLVTVRAEELDPARPVERPDRRAGAAAARRAAGPGAAGARRGGRAGGGDHRGGAVGPADGPAGAARGGQPVLHRGTARRRAGRPHAARVGP